jgi:hypothetical protein
VLHRAVKLAAGEVLKETGVLDSILELEDCLKGKKRTMDPDVEAIWTNLVPILKRAEKNGVRLAILESLRNFKERSYYMDLHR